MLVYILDKERKPAGVANTLQTLIWDRRANEPGMFEVHCTSQEFDLLREGKYVFRDDRTELGVILAVGTSQAADGSRTCYAKGYFAEYTLNDRVVDKTARLSGTPEYMSRKLVTDYVINAKGYAGRAIPDLQLGDLSDVPQEESRQQVTGKPVGDALYNIEATQGLSHRIRYDFKFDNMYFECWKGRDDGPLFSDEYNNILSASYSKDITDAPNVVYVAGCGEGEERIVRIIDAREDPDEYARELYVDARDLQKTWTNDDGETEEYTDEEYDALLYSRGLDKLAQHKALESFDLSVDPNINLVYLQDYDIGDICTVRITVDRHGNTFDLDRQITSIRESYEGGKTSLSLTFGDAGPTSLTGYMEKNSEAVTPVTETPATVGNLAKLETEAKGNLVDAINETKTDVGDLEELETDEKESIVKAVNELKEKVDAGGGGGSASVKVLTNKSDKAEAYADNALTYNVVMRTADGINSYVTANVKRKKFALCAPDGLKYVDLGGDQLFDTGIIVVFSGTSISTDTGVSMPVPVANVMCRLMYRTSFSAGGKQYVAYYPYPYVGYQTLSSGAPGEGDLFGMGRWDTFGFPVLDTSGNLICMYVPAGEIFIVEKEGSLGASWLEARPVFEETDGGVTFYKWGKFRVPSMDVKSPTFVSWL